MIGPVSLLALWPYAIATSLHGTGSRGGITGVGPSLSRDDIQSNMMRQFKGQ